MDLRNRIDKEKLECMISNEEILRFLEKGFNHWRAQILRGQLPPQHFQIKYATAWETAERGQGMFMIEGIGPMPPEAVMPMAADMLFQRGFYPLIVMMVCDAWYLDEDDIRGKNPAELKINEHPLKKRSVLLHAYSLDKRAAAAQITYDVSEDGVYQIVGDSVILDTQIAEADDDPAIQFMMWAEKKRGQNRSYNRFLDLFIDGVIKCLVKADSPWLIHTPGANSEYP